MSLFGDLPSARNPAQTSVPEAPFESRGASYAKSTIRTPLHVPPSILRSRKRKADDEQLSKAENGTSVHGLFAAFGPIQDEYDPAVPNEYEKAKQAQQDAVLDAERETRKAAQDRGNVWVLIYCRLSSKLKPWHHESFQHQACAGD